MKKVMTGITGIVMIIVASCSKGGNGNNGGVMESPVDCSGAAKSFTTDVNPIIQASCTNAGCHNSGSNNGPGPLLTYQQIFNARISIRSAVASGFMPQNSKLSDAQKNAILCWIDNGAANN